MWDVAASLASKAAVIPRGRSLQIAADPGFSMGSNGDFMGISWGFHGDFMGISWGLLIVEELISWGRFFLLQP